jgi:hypothetical protein
VICIFTPPEPLLLHKSNFIHCLYHRSCPLPLFLTLSHLLSFYLPIFSLLISPSSSLSSYSFSFCSSLFLFSFSSSYSSSFFSSFSSFSTLLGAVNGMRPDGSTDESCMQSREVTLYTSKFSNTGYTVSLSVDAAVIVPSSLLLP